MDRHHFGGQEINVHELRATLILLGTASAPQCMCVCVCVCVRVRQLYVYQKWSFRVEL